jgi:protein-disulfide isomerase
MNVRMFNSLGALALSLLVAAGAYGSQPNADDVAKLKADVARLSTQQQQILDSLDDLKKMLKGPGQPALKPPATMGLAGEPFKGQGTATLAIMEYADFQCPFCRHFEHDVYPQIRENYIDTGKVKYFHRDMPLPFHQGALPAARAAHCASEQGKFWEMHDSLLGDGASLSAADIDERAGKLGLNVSKLDECIASDRFADIIQRSVTEANQMKISGTPTFIIGTLDSRGTVMSVKKTVVGANPFEAFKEALDALLASAK